MIKVYYNAQYVVKSGHKSTFNPFHPYFLFVAIGHIKPGKEQLELKVKDVKFSAELMENGEIKFNDQGKNKKQWQRNRKTY